MAPIATVESLLKSRWSTKNATEKLNHTVVIGTPLTDEFVDKKDFKGQIGANFDVEIKTGAGVVLKSISASAEHLVQDRGNVVAFSASTARYALEGTLTPETLDEISSFDDKDQPLALAEAIGDIQREHKESFEIATEHQTAGALMNKVVDGDGKVLFELDVTQLSVEFKANKNLRDSFNEVKRTMKKELGREVKISVKASAGFIDNIYQLATTEDLFKKGLAKEIEENGESVLVIHGVKIKEHTPSYFDTDGNAVDTIAENKAVFVPIGARILKARFSRASDTAATGKKPTLNFGAVEQLPKGRGWSVRSERRILIYNSRPKAIVIGAFIGV